MRKLAIFAAAFTAATAFYVYLWQDIRVVWIAGGCLLISIVSLWINFRRLCIVCLGLAAALCWCRIYDQLYLAPVREISGSQQSMTVQLQEVVESKGYASVRVRIQGRTYEARLYGELPQARPGDYLSGTMNCEFEEEGSYLRGKGLVMTLKCHGEMTVEEGTVPPAMAVRLWLQERLQMLYDGERLGLLRALLTGDQSGLSDGMRSDFAVAGLSHAVAVSGMHVSVLMTMLAFCCGKNPRFTALLGIPAAVFFTLMTGASPSACRAAVMQIFLLTAPLLHRRRDALTSLGGAALVLLMENPWVISNLSFQLSFAAVSGLLLLAKPIQTRILSLWKKPGRVAKFLATSMAASLGATAFTLPLTTIYFRMVSLSAVAVNLLTLWAVTGAFILGLVSCVLPVAAVPAGILADYILELCRLVAKFPYGAAYLENLPLMIWSICAYGLVYRLLLGRKRRTGLHVVVVSAAFLGCVVWGRWNLAGSPPVYRVLDVGQGQCTLLEANGFTAVIDCGGEYPAEAGDQLVQTLHSGGKTAVDALVITHYDADHAGGAVQLLRRVKAAVVLLPDVEDDTGMRTAIETAAQEAGSKLLPVSCLTEIDFSDGKLTVYPPLSLENDNNMGISVLATAAEYDILITGDLDIFTEMKLLSAYDLPTVELLVAGHHGAGTSTSQVLLDTLRPTAVAISVGENNSYGHPHTETLARIDESGAEIYRTDELGTLVFRP